DGDDFNEPIADAVRGILDGHFVLDRAIAGQGRFPAINVLISVSRVMTDIANKDHLEAASQMKKWLARYEENKELIQIGAYKKGASREIDEAIQIYPQINDFLRQGIEEKVSAEETVEKLQALVYKG